MPSIEIANDVDARLESVCPEYLKGERMTTRRVLWAIDEYLKEHQNGSSDERSISESAAK